MATPFEEPVFVRRHAAAVLIVLQAQDDPSMEFGVFVRQPQVGIGRSDFLEIVGGMLDRSAHLDRISLSDAIRKQIEDETGLIFAPEDFTNLTQWQRLHAKSKRSFRSSDELTEGCPTLDQFIHLFCVVKPMPFDTILSLCGRNGGQERTGIQILPLRDALFVCTDVNFLSAFALFSAWRKTLTEGLAVRRAASPALAMMGLTSTHRL